MWAIFMVPSLLFVEKRQAIQNLLPPLSACGLWSSLVSAFLAV